MIDPTQDLPQEQAADYQTYTVAGSHREIGHWQGERFPAVGPDRDDMDPDHYDFARKCLDQVERYYPGLVEEAEGYAEAADQPVEDLLWHFCLDAGKPPAHCSTVGVLTPDGPVLARNYDFFYFEDRRHLVTTHPAGALSHTGIWEGLIGGRFDGVNEAGVWVSIHGGGTRRPAKATPGLGFHLICRTALERARSAREAVDLIVRLPHIAGYNYFVADREAMYVVEAHPERVRVREPKSGILACTNHPLHPEMLPLAHTGIAENSRGRLERLLEGARQALAAPDPAAVLQATMRDHTVPVCGHTDGLATFWSAVCIPGRHHVAYSLGAPCRNAYTPAVWPAV
ncbi:MAG TPA: C45 family peptidase [Symbiobacteriaceae bacterium]|jgi:hypothetical protein